MIFICHRPLLFRLAKKHDYRVVIMGHTHENKLDEDSMFLRENRVYANSGYWATEKPSYVRVTKESGTYTVALFEKKKGQFNIKQEESVRQ